MKASERRINHAWTKHYSQKNEMENKAIFSPSKVVIMKPNGVCVDVTQKYIESSNA